MLPCWLPRRPLQPQALRCHSTGAPDQARRRSTSAPDRALRCHSTAAPDQALPRRSTPLPSRQPRRHTGLLRRLGRAGAHAARQRAPQRPSPNAKCTPHTPVPASRTPYIQLSILGGGTSVDRSVCTIHGKRTSPASGNEALATCVALPVKRAERQPDCSRNDLYA